MSEVVRSREGLFGCAVVEDLRQNNGEVAVDKLEGFINKYGSPGAGVGVDKPGEFINSQTTGDESQVAVEEDETCSGGGLLQGIPPSPRPSPGGRGSEAGNRLQATVEKNFGAGIDRGGRPATITPAMQDRICTLLSVGFSRRQAAAYVEIDQSTISRTAKRDPEFAECLKRAEEKATLQPMLTVISEAQKNWRAAVWLIQHKANQPVVLTEEEKEEKHQQDLADARRRAEESKEWMRAMSSSDARVSQSFQPTQTVRVKRSGKGKRQAVTRTVVTTGRVSK